MLQKWNCEKANIEIENIKNQIENTNTNLPPEARKSRTTTIYKKPFQAVATFQTANRSLESEEDIYSTIEYRKAFQNYVLKGEAIPEKFNEKEQQH